MKLLISFFVISLLKQDVCSYPGLMELPVVLHSCRRYIYIHTADCAVLVLYAVDSVNTLKYILYRIHLRILTGLYGQSLVSHILKGHDFLSDLILCQFLSCNMFILYMVRTVHAPIYTVI